MKETEKNKKNFKNILIDDVTFKLEAKHFNRSSYA